MHDLAFADANRPTPVRVLRLPLRPYSLGHEILLTLKRNALLLLSEEEFNTLPAEKQRFALIQAALICSATWRENQKPHRWLRIWQWTINRSHRSNPSYFPLQLAEFRNYLNAGRACPPAPDEVAFEFANRRKTETGRHYGGPALARLLDFVCTIPEGARTSMSASAAPPERGWPVRANSPTVYDFPLALAQYLYLSKLEAEGLAYIENAREAQALAELTEVRQDIAEKKRQDQQDGKDDEPAASTAEPEVGRASSRAADLSAKALAPADERSEEENPIQHPASSDSDQRVNPKSQIVNGKGYPDA